MHPPLSKLTPVQLLISAVCSQLTETLLEKNRKYGNSAIHPIRIFSNASPIEQINVRLDDKLSRIILGQVDETEDTEFDLAGYLILKMVAKRLGDKNDPITEG